MPLRVVCVVLLQRFPRKATTLLLACVCVFCSVISSQAAAEDVTRRPNFVVIMADDLGYGDLSPYGGWINVPHIEKLAAEGMQFSDFHASGSLRFS